jgi:hypothetical protein
MAITKNRETKKPAGGDASPASQKQESGSAIVSTGPQGPPPGQSVRRGAPEEESATASLWRRNQKITGLWCKNETRNSWISIAGVGWRKLGITTDSGVTALNILASQALQTGRSIDCREEADGMIHEIYLW